MSESRSPLLGVYVDGETKTGKGAAGHAIADALRQEGLAVYYDVAGDFFRRFVALVRLDLGLQEEDELPEGAELEAAAERVYNSREPFAQRDDLGDLQRPAISHSVAVLGKLPLVQKAGGEWWAMTMRLAVAAKAEVVVLDGRNPRSRVQDQVADTGIQPVTALELFMTCEPEVAARRALLAKGVLSPVPNQLAEETRYVITRRELDRQRDENPFQLPEHSVAYDPATSTPQAIIDRSWSSKNSTELPITITLDNTHLAMTDMLHAVTQLAVVAVSVANARQHQQLQSD
ncbi:MAG TPA: (d)CMP kinase [Candidatus Saccharimonadales bacterium]|nr:(d)CMP kinase [Candidatus Saccharimonadales bacterium]